MDLFVPMTISGLSGRRYTLLVVNDYSRFIWVYFFISNDKTFENFINLIRNIENELNDKLKSIHSDRERKFNFTLIKIFCNDKNIFRIFFVAGFPQENGVDERKNKILIEYSITILSASKWLESFWSEAVHTVCYKFNRLLISKHHGKNPYEFLENKKSSVSYFHVFRCL